MKPTLCMLAVPVFCLSSEAEKHGMREEGDLQLQSQEQHVLSMQLLLSLRRRIQQLWAALVYPPRVQP